MKFSILALGAAVAGISSPSLAQLHIQTAPKQLPEARLVSQNQDFFSTFNSSQTDSRTHREESDYFAESSPQAEIAQPAPTSRPILEKPITTNNSAANANSAVPQAPLHVLDVTPEVGMVPVCWQSAAGCPTPNPVASYMMMNWCTDGLWDNYACQRARKCAYIQRQLYGHNRYTGGCATCGTSSCGIASGGHCASCQPSAAHCAVNALPALQNPSQVPPMNAMAQTPVATSPFLGELQVGLPVVDLPQVPAGFAARSGVSMPAQLTTAPADNRAYQPLPAPELPSDVPVVPSVEPTPAVQFPPLPGTLPALPVPTASPVIARGPSASFR